jgi:hypothetical protein
MRKYSTAIIGVILLLAAVLPHAYGEKSTEIFIPIGLSPGLSGKYTQVGKIDRVDMENEILTIRDPAGVYSVRVTNRTEIWLDKSKVKLSNLKGTLADCRKGLLVEVKFEDNLRERPAEWIKVQVDQ